MKRFLLIVMLFPLCAGLAPGATQVTDLKCENRRQPLGIDVAHPRLSWLVQSDRRGDVQTAYQVLVASSQRQLEADQGDLWDSGKVASVNAIQIPYGGKALAKNSTCYWKVRIWDKVEAISAWSKSATWDMGLLLPEDWQAQWLNDGKANPLKDEDFYREDPAPLFRREFQVSKAIQRARLFITGLGYYEASMNGGRIGDQVLDPGWTRYSQRTLYSTYDVTRQLVQGQNCLGVMLGNGWYNPLPLRMWGYLNLRNQLPVGRPRFLARLDITFTDGSQQSVVSDTSWQVGDGPVRFNSIYLGEIYDARKEVPGWDQSGYTPETPWRPASLASESIGRLAAQSQPPIRITQTFKPVALSEPRPGLFIVDLGKNFGGWVNLKCSAPAGTRLELRYGELLNKDGTLNPMTSVCGQIKGKRANKEGQEESVGGPGAPAIAWQADTYITSGRGQESYTPRFTFHAFRYVEISGYPGKLPLDAITGLRLNSDVERIGEFSCSNERFNQLQTMCDTTFLSNLFSVQSDCPHRERFGYGGDIAATSEAFLMNYDMADFYAKAVRDWHDSALANGMLTDTAPSVGIQYCGPAWAMAHPLLQRQLYQYGGDRRLIEDQYATAKRWLELVAAANPTGIIAAGLSDHEALVQTPAPVMVTPLYAASAKTVGALAAILGKNEDATRCVNLAESIRTAYVGSFFNQTTGAIGPGTQASQVFSLYGNMLAAEQRSAALQCLLADIRGPHKQHLSTGIFGTKYLLDVLSREGHSQVAYDLVNQGGFPGWHHMLDRGATTLWEHWQEDDNTYSHNHPMFGSVSQWFFHWLGGIQPASEAVGFDQIMISPQMPKGLDWVKCSYRSVRGNIVCHWRREQHQVTLDLAIPVGVSALVAVPGEDVAHIEENGQPVAQALGVVFVRKDATAAVYRLGSGHYGFTVKRGK